MMKYPKIFALGHRTIKNLWNGNVEITEKVDGSQLRFWKTHEGTVQVASKGAMIYPETVDKLFEPVCDYLHSIADRIPFGFIFTGETLCKPKHTTLKYDRVPLNHLALFAVYDFDRGCFLDHYMITLAAANLGVDTVPLLYSGQMDMNLEELDKLLDTESFLGGTKIEGFVVKNYEQDNMIGDQYIPMLQGKYVSEEFKEKHVKDWKGKGAGAWGIFCEQYKNENLWLKAVQRMRDAGELLGEPKDIGQLLGEIHRDIEDEHKDDILEFLWKTKGKELKRVACHGAAEWYKRALADGTINELLHIDPYDQHLEKPEQCE
jgi:hypothetical protein